MRGKCPPGQRLTALRPAAAPRSEAPLLQAEGLRSGRKLEHVSVTVRRREVVGLAGLLGSGRLRDGAGLFGLDGRDSGEYGWGRCLAVLAAGRHRGRHGLFAGGPQGRGHHPGAVGAGENLTLAALPGLSRLGVVRGRQRELVDVSWAGSRIKAASLDQPIRELSGGTSKRCSWPAGCAATPGCCCSDEPSAASTWGPGGNTGAGERAGRGRVGRTADLLRLDQLIASSRRIIVLRDGRSVAELQGGGIHRRADLAGHGRRARARGGRPGLTHGRSAELAGAPGRRRAGSRSPSPPAAPLLLVLVNAVSTPHFATGSNLMNILLQVSTAVLVGLGMTVVLATAGVDLSVGSVMAVASVAAAWAIPQGTAAAVLAGLAAAAGSGPQRPAGRALPRRPPFIVTLAMLITVPRAGPGAQQRRRSGRL